MQTRTKALYATVRYRRCSSTGGQANFRVHKYGSKVRATSGLHTLTGHVSLPSCTSVYSFAFSSSVQNDNKKHELNKRSAAHPLIVASHTTVLSFSFSVIPPPCRPSSRSCCLVPSGYRGGRLVLCRRPRPCLLGTAGRVIRVDGINIHFVCAHHCTACIIHGTGDRGCNW